MFDPTRDEWFECPMFGGTQHILVRSIQDDEIAMEGDEIHFVSVAGQGSGKFGVYTAIAGQDTVVFKGWFSQELAARTQYSKVQQAAKR